MTGVPTATYRLQFSPTFTFADAAALVPYLDDLGISHVYASPYLKARPGSLHGYDVVDHNTLNPDLGGEPAFVAWIEALSRHGMGHILDFVPNHMGIAAADNPWWLDVLEWGRLSPFADFFDIDWERIDAKPNGKILLPFLGDDLERVLERGELQLGFDPEIGGFFVFYFEHRFPLNPRSYPLIPTDEPLASLLRNGGEDLKRTLADAARRDPAVTRAIAAAVRRFDAASPGVERRLRRLLGVQCYRLAHWREAGRNINYRRFFDIDDLAALRMERDDVFDAVHRLVFRLMDEGRLQGLRIDHIDGLSSPRGYLAKIAGRTHGCYVVVEKILADHERLRGNWPVAGSTGYEFLNQLNGLFVDPSGKEPLLSLFRRFTGIEDSFGDLLLQCKRLIMETSLAGDLKALANLLERLVGWETGVLEAAVKEVAACYPVYRSYVDKHGADADDRRDIDAALDAVSGIDERTIDILRRVLTGEHRKALPFVRRFQQFTGPVMAKAMEDTAFYRFVPLVSLNEVGGDPRHFGLSVSDFHDLNAERAELRPHSLLGTATHDTKRGEDVRARLNVLSEMPREWENRVRRWAEWNKPAKTWRGQEPAPSAKDEYLLYQTLVGSWPLALAESGHWNSEDLDPYLDRVAAYMVKAAREAKMETSWTDADPEYEEALRAFVASLLHSSRPNAFLEDFLAFERTIAFFGMINGLSQTVLKLTAPGVPDVYQGGELWDLSLVDPDNRRPVDFDLRARFLADLVRDVDTRQGPNRIRRLVDTWRDGRIKLHVSRRLLRLRRDYPTLFLEGSYRPLTVVGERSEHLCAFARWAGGSILVTAAPRLVPTLTRFETRIPVGADVWGDTMIVLDDEPAETRLRNPLTGEALEVERENGRATVSVARLLDVFPIAVLVSP